MQFPQLFGIVRTYPMRPPSLQFFRAELGHPRPPRSMRSLHDDDFYIIRAAPPHVQVEIDSDVGLNRRSLDTGIYTLRYKHPRTNQIDEVYSWSLPFTVYFRGSRELIPILEFQYRSWIPVDANWSLEIPMTPREVMNILSEVNRLRTEEIRRMEDQEEVQTVWGGRGRTPVGFGAGHGPDDWDDRVTGNPDEFVGAGGRRRTHARTPTPPSIRSAPTVIERVVERLVERVVVQSQPLPKPVGDLLLSTARKGPDSCPITAVPFPECESLSVTSCFHVFDTRSLTRWRESHTTCPVCRSAIQNIVSETA